jgi:hypothetical protein
METAEATLKASVQHSLEQVTAQQAYDKFLAGRLDADEATRMAAFEPLPAWCRLNGMEKVVHDLLAPHVRSFISDWGFALFQKLANWLDAKVPSRAARVVLGLLLGLSAIFSVVTVTALAGF